MGARGIDTAGLALSLRIGRNFFWNFKLRASIEKRSRYRLGEPALSFFYRYLFKLRAFLI